MFQICMGCRVDGVGEKGGRDTGGTLNIISRRVTRFCEIAEKLPRGSRVDDTLDQSFQVIDKTRPK